MFQLTFHNCGASVLHCGHQPFSEGPIHHNLKVGRNDKRLKIVNIFPIRESIPIFKRVTSFHFLQIFKFHFSRFSLAYGSEYKKMYIKFSLSQTNCFEIKILSFKIPAPQNVISPVQERMHKRSEHIIV